jgi:hypothetical protein
METTSDYIEINIKATAREIENIKKDLCSIFTNTDLKSQLKLTRK